MMHRRKFLVKSSLAGSAAFIGTGSLEAVGIQMLQAKMLLNKEEYQHLTSFAKEFDSILQTHPERPLFLNKAYWVDQLVERKTTANGYEVYCKNTNGDILVLTKKGERKFVKILKEV